MKEKLVNLKQSKFETRVHEIDFIRGVCIILMLFDHFFYDLMLFTAYWVSKDKSFYNLYYFSVAYWESPFRLILRQIGVFIFVFLSGVSFKFSRNNLKRGIRITLFAIAITIASRLANYVIIEMTGSDMGINIDFNVIHVLAISILLGYLLRKRSNICLGIIAGLTFILSIALSIMNSSMLIQNDNTLLNVILFPLGIVNFDYQRADYLAFIPSFGFFLLGIIVARLIYKTVESRIKRVSVERPFCFVGRNSLLFYLGHQIVLMGVFILYSLIAHLPLPF